MPHRKGKPVPRVAERTALAVAGLLVLTAPLAAQEAEWTEIRARRQADGVRAVSVDVEYVAGELRVSPAADGLLYDTRLRYDAARLKPERDFSVDGDVGRLKIGFEGLGEDGDIDFDVDEDEHGYLELGLSPDVPTDLKLRVGAALSDVDLGGIPITGLVYETGASETELRIGSRNPVVMERMKLAAGAARFTASGLGNARFEKLEFRGGVGEVELDFTGEWSADASATLEMGLGSLKLEVPEDLGVRIAKTGFLASLDAPGFERVDGGWQSRNWESAPHHLDLSLRAALGSIEVRRVP